jgi:Phosphomannose isomerase
MSFVENGPLAGKSLAEISAEYGKSLLGSNCDDGKFPLLVKIIDAKERLSAQVHPNEDAAAKFGGEPKTEMWHVLGAPHGAFVCSGLKEGTGPRIFSDAVKARHLDALLKTLPVEPGKSVFIPGGLVHAICENCLIFEVQQNSNTTYRIHDWNRVGPDGKPRELHLRQALEVIDWRAPDIGLVQPASMPPSNPANTRERLLRSDFFTLEKRAIRAAEPFKRDGRSFLIVFAAKGAVEISFGGAEPFALPFGRSCLIPAALQEFEITPSASAADGASEAAEIITVEV